MWLIFQVNGPTAVEKIILEFLGSETVAEVRSAFLETIGKPTDSFCTLYYNQIPIKAGTQPISQVRDICDFAEINTLCSQQGTASLGSWSSGPVVGEQGSQFQSLLEGFGRADRAAIERLKKTGRSLQEVIAAYTRLDRDEVLTRAELLRARLDEGNP
jgi:hypothetical protein